MCARMLMVALLFATGSAFAGGPPPGATIVEFYGPHPIDPSVHAGLCTIPGHHLHSYRPHQEVLYVQDGPVWTFVGDPTEFEPRPRVRHAYYGHHPVWWTHAPGEHYCYITGPHHHGHAPPATLAFTERGGVFWYVGAHPVWYEKKRRHKHHLDRHYHTHVIARPVVTVAPPSGWVGVTFGVGGVGAAVGLELGAPGVVHEHTTTPLVIEHHHHHHGPPAWGHRKHDPRFPGRGGDHKPGRGKDKGRGR